VIFLIVDKNCTLHEPKEVLFNVQVEVENFKFLMDIVVMDMAKCLVTLGRPFLDSSKAHINLKHKEIVPRSKGK
jgi:hypothetical protein